MSTRAATRAAMNELERQAKMLWLGGAAHIHYGLCHRCRRVRDENGVPLLVARQTRRREFECLDCWDQRQ